MEEVGTTSWDTIRLVISCLVGGMAAAQMSRPNQTDEEKKVIGWSFLIVAIAAFIFIKAVIVICGLLAFLFVANAIGPQVIKWTQETKDGISAEVGEWDRFRPPKALPNNRLLEEIEEALENGASNDELTEHIQRRKNSNPNRNGR
mgnify:CR=1 FL=1